MLSIQNLIQGIDLKKIQESDQRFYRASLRVGDTVPANDNKPTNLVVQSLGVFLCVSMTGRFTTLDTGPADTGVCRMSMKWVNGSQRVYIDQPIFLDCLFTPGRVKSPGVTGDASGQLQFPGLPWVTIFQPKDTLTFTVQNDAAYANTWQMALHGIWIKS